MTDTTITDTGMHASKLYQKETPTIRPAMPGPGHIHLSYYQRV
jgi:hypothetical protein